MGSWMVPVVSWETVDILDWSLWEIVWHRLGPLYHDVSFCIPVPYLCSDTSTNLQITSLQVAKHLRSSGIRVTRIHLRKLQQNTGNIQPTVPIQPMALSDTRDYNRAIARGSWPRGGTAQGGEVHRAPETNSKSLWESMVGSDDSFYLWGPKFWAYFPGANLSC